MLNKSPDIRFNIWYKYYSQYLLNHTKGLYPNSAALSTASLDGVPDSRMILCKDLENSQFIFYTNILSAKGKQILNNPQASLLFFWPHIQRQVRVQGLVSVLPDSNCDEYFESRSKESRISANISKQSEVLEDSRFLRRQFHSKYNSNKPIDRPPHWIGLIIEPRIYEFWREDSHRLHKRWKYIKQPNGEYEVTTLYP